MAAAPDPDKVLSSTREKANFQRVARLLISGGTSLMREIFDQLCPPSNLLTKLKNPASVKQLKAAKLTKPQWDCLYPSPGVYGKSADFDVTLLFKLLRTICSLAPPATGWDVLPTSADHSLAADLARIKYYRNSVYGHVSQNMEITEDEFPQLWQDISEALLRIAGQISSAKKTAWKELIDNLLKDPLTTEGEQNVQELLRWYRNDVDVKECIEGLRVELKSTSQEVQCVVRQEVQDIKDQLEGELKSTTQEIRCLEKAVREESQDIKDQLEGELKTTGQGVQSLVREQAQDIKEDLKSTTQEVRCLEKAVREESQDIKDQLEGELKTTGQGVQSLVREQAQDIREELQSTTQCLEKAVREESQDIKDQLGEMHQSIERLSSSADGPQAGKGQFKITRLLFTKTLTWPGLFERWIVLSIGKRGLVFKHLSTG